MDLGSVNHTSSADAKIALFRLYDSKRDVRIYDYADLNVPMLARMFDWRCRGYEAAGYKLLLPDRRLQTLSETKGRFRLNATLPIPFDGSGSLEVDLLCDEVRVAVELNGAQHLADPIAYRRDRRKVSCCRRMAIWCCAFLLKMLAKSSTWCSTPSFGHGAAEARQSARAAL